MIALGVALWAAALITLPPRPARLPSLRGTGVGTVGDSARRTAVIVVAVITAVAIAAFGGVCALIAAVVVVGTAVHRRSAKRRRRHRRGERDSLITGLDTVIGELRVGAHPAIACGTAATECIGSVAEAFGTAAGRARLGGTAHAGLRVIGSPVSTELAVLAGAWRVADEHGLGLVGLLGAARGDLLARNRFRDRTEASLAGARATGTVLACLPVLGVLLGQAMGAAPLAVLLGGGLGGVLLALGCGLCCAGLLWTDAITERVCT